MSRVFEYYEPTGAKFFDIATNREMILIEDEKSSYKGWLCYKHPDGQWVTLRKATNDDIEKIKAAKRIKGE